MKSRRLVISFSALAGGLFLTLKNPGGGTRAGSGEDQHLSGTAENDQAAAGQGAAGAAGLKAAAAGVAASGKTVDSGGAGQAGLPAKIPAMPQTAFDAEPAAAAFSEWTGRYLAAPAEGKAALVAEGVTLAAARRPVFQEVIRRDPRLALAAAVPMVVRQDLPREVTDLLEARVNGRGALRVYQGVGADNLSPVPTHRIAELANGATYLAHVYGRRAESVQWVADASVNGVSVDNDLAVNEDPFRPLETGERPDPDRKAVEVCPVSGNSSLKEEDKGLPITEETPAVEAYGEIVYLCDGSHTTIFQQTLIQGEGSTGGPLTFTGLLPAAPTPSIGNVKVLVIPMTFADQNDTPSTESTLYNLMRSVGDHYAKASYGKLTLLSTVTPPITLPHNEAWYVQQDSSNGGAIDGLGLEHSHARAEARKLGFDDDDYDCIVVRLKGGARPAGGWGGGRSVWIYGDGPDVTAHEVGHVFGLAHANFWDTAGTSAIGSGTNGEYGGYYDVMGGFGLPNGHYNVQAKNQIRWLPDDFVTEATTSGLYRIYAQDQAILDPGKRFALRIRKDNLRTYWGELRGLHTGSATETWTDQGLILGWKYPGAGGSNIQLIDTTPGSSFGKTDSPISLGRTFSDTEAGIHMTTLAVNPATATAPKSVDVQVNFGGFPDNHKPALSLAVSAAVVPVNVPVTFTATATDEDGDALAFSWQHFGDSNYRTISPNSPVITRTFAASGTYVISCTVSDMKGGSAIRSQLVTVGNGGGNSTISGRITLDGAGLAGVIVNANSANGVITDSDGFYTIPNLPAATYIMTPLLYGYTFTELFNNSIRVAPSAGGADFEAAGTPQVTLTALVPTAEEGNAAPGKFLLSRTGDASQALVVNFTGYSGTASSGDYTASPALVSASQSLSTLTIPAGADSLEVSITPVNDTAAEGAETLTLQVASGNGYLVSGLGSATVTVLDDDTTLPRVRLAVVEAKTIEGSGIPATVRLSRSGATAGSLAVGYSITGTAVNGGDYTALTGAAEIPDGADNVLISVSALNDAASESIETVVLKLKPQAAYINDPAGETATVSIVDDDLQIVNVAASDAVATEKNLSVGGTAADTATFLITRSGDTTLPLTVYYAMAGTPSGSMATALHGVDYEALPGVLTIPAGQSSGAVTILPRWDGLGEAPESVTLQLGAGPTNYQLGPDNTASVVIHDGGDPPYVEVIAIDNAAEGSPVAAGAFRFSLKGSATGSVSVKYTVSGTAASGADFTVLSGTVTIPGNGINTVEVPVNPINDGVAEDLETVVVTITPNAAYGIYAASASAMIQLRDATQPTVFVDASDSDYPPAFGEDSSSGGSFYLSRTGAATAALTVNYTMSGTATSGTDYTALSGSAVIPVGAKGVLVPIRPINDTVAEGTETAALSLAPGAYSRAGSATFYITDNEAPASSVAFPAPGMSVAESAGTVNIPVTLSAASAAPVKVEYLVDRSTHDTASSNGTATTAVPPLPYWVRCRKEGGTITGSISKDGLAWVEISSQTVSFTGAGSLAGLVVCSYNTATACAAKFDNVTVEGGAGGTPGTVLSGNRLGTAALAGSHSETAGVYTVNGGGDNLEGTTDQGYFASWPVTGSGDCTITARVTSLTNTNTLATAGVMIRESTVNNAARGFTAATAGSGFEFHSRAATGLSDARFSAPGAPFWVRLQRAGENVSAFQSADGLAWTPVGATVPLAMGNEVMAGLALSSFAEGSVATAQFDEVTLSGGGTVSNFEGRTIGLSGTQGMFSVEGGTFTVSSSGDGFVGTADDGFFVNLPVAGDFTLTARVLSTQGPGTTRAGLMLRQAADRRARMAFVGAASGGVPQFIRRQTSTNTAYGTGVDYLLPAGVLTIPAGETTANIPLTVQDDTIPEPDETVIVILRNAMGARIGTNYQFAMVIADNDSPPLLPSAGFTAAASSAAEGAGMAQVAVALSTAPVQATAMNYTVAAGTAVAGTDFTPSTGQIIFSAGQTVGFVPVALLDDAGIESSKTVLLTLTGGTGAVLGTLVSHTLTITDDDSASVTVASTDTSAAESGDTATAAFTRTGSLTNPLTVNYSRTGTAAGGADYSGLTGSVIIPAGAASADAVLTPVQDTLSEGSETVILTVTTGAGYTPGKTASATLTIADDDRNVVSIAATTPTATEGGGAGVFTVTRGGVTTGSLNVTLSLTGTASSGTDFTTNPATVTSLPFAAGQTERTITITPVNDTVIEGNEVIIAQIGGGTYDIGGDGYTSVTLVDNDIPPTVFISSPGAQGVVVAPGNGIKLRATLNDDGLPQAVTATWSMVAGPGAVTFDPPSGTSGETAATFTEAGTYLIRVTASDGQFSSSDQISLTVGSPAAAVPSGWISADVGPPTAHGFSGMSGGSWHLNGAGTGYASNSDRAHAVGRTVEGNGTVIARLTSLNGNGQANAEAGLFIRDSWHRYARRAVLAYTGSSRTLKFRTRVTNNTNDTSVSVTNMNLPLWLKLERVEGTDTVTAFRAVDNAGAPGAWTAVGTASVIDMDAGADYGLTTDSGNDGVLAEGVFDNVTLTPAAAGPGVISEDFGDGAQTGTYSYAAAGDVHTVNGQPGGLESKSMFHGQEFTGDFMITVLHQDANSGAANAYSGLMIRDTMDDGPMAFVGRNPFSAYSSFIWRTNAKGSTSGLNGISQRTRWLRLIRRGNQVTALHAADNSGTPGAWAQLGQPRSVFMAPTVLAGLSVCNGDGVGFNTAKFTKLTVVPLNRAPVVDAGSVAANPASPLALTGVITDDGLPQPVTTSWTAPVAAGAVTFADASARATTASFFTAGAYTLRLQADDGMAASFDDVSFTGTGTGGSPFTAWQTANFPGSGGTGDAAAMADPDHDGLANLCEYALGSDPKTSSGSPLSIQPVIGNGSGQIRITLPKNPDATDAILRVEASADPGGTADWSTDGLTIESETATELRVLDNIGTNTRRFYRLRVIRME
ncbi:MAG: Calx-beta domain-containing protein [Verrucomicrobiota bacterium]